MLISGEGRFQVKKYENQINTVIIGELDENQIIGAKFSLFESVPNISVQTLNYSTLALISSDDFN